MTSKETRLLPSAIVVLRKIGSFGSTRASTAGSLLTWKGKTTNCIKGRDTTIGLKSYIVANELQVGRELHVSPSQPSLIPRPFPGVEQKKRPGHHGRNTRE